MSQYIEISIFFEKRLLWRPFEKGCSCGDLQLYKIMTPSQILSCEICEVLQNIIFKENFWATASDFLDVSCISCFKGNKSNNYLKLPTNSSN